MVYVSGTDRSAPGAGEYRETGELPMTFWPLGANPGPKTRTMRLCVPVGQGAEVRFIGSVSAPRCGVIHGIPEAARAPGAASVSTASVVTANVSTAAATNATARSGVRGDQDFSGTALASISSGGSSRQRGTCGRLLHRPRWGGIAPAPLAPAPEQ